MKSGHFDFHLFNELNLEVFYGDRDMCWKGIEKSFQDQEKGLDMGDKIEAANGTTFYVLGHDPKMWLKKLPNDPKSYGVASHEAVHVVDWLEDVTGINDKEFRGYMVDHIVRLLGLAAKKHGKEIPKKKA